MVLGLRRFDIQAKYACFLSVTALAPFAFAAWIILRNYDSRLGQIVYGARGQFITFFGLGIILSFLPAALGMVLGWSSAGQRRNDRQAQSWTGFFIGGFVLTMDLIFLAAFVMLRLERPM